MATPKITDRATWQAELDAPRAREKAYTRAGDALAAQRQRLPMVEVDAKIQLVGANATFCKGPLRRGRSQSRPHGVAATTNERPSAQLEDPISARR